MDKSHEYLTVEEAARLLRIGRTHAYQLARSGALPGVRRFGKSIRVRRSALLGDEAAQCGSGESTGAERLQPPPLRGEAGANAA